MGSGEVWEVQGQSKEASWPWDYRLKVQEHRWRFPLSFQPQGMTLAAAADPAGSEAGVTSRIIAFLGHGVVCTALGLAGCAFLRETFADKLAELTESTLNSIWGG